jgi:hypothetical protein
VECDPEAGRLRLTVDRPLYAPRGGPNEPVANTTTVMPRLSDTTILALVDTTFLDINTHDGPAEFPYF